MEEDLKTITLEELAKGAAGERWAHEFERLLDNTLDPNRDAEAKRSIEASIIASLPVNEIRNQPGDSTMAPHSGWASAFCARQVKSSVACLNVGRGGRSISHLRAPWTSSDSIRP